MDISIEARKKYFWSCILGLGAGLFMVFGPAWIPAFGNFISRDVAAMSTFEVVKSEIIYFSFSYVFFLIYMTLLFFQKTFRDIQNKPSFLFFSGGLLMAVLFFAFAANMALSGLGSFS